jgi:hypothetical protein
MSTHFGTGNEKLPLLKIPTRLLRTAATVLFVALASSACSESVGVE